ncbi:OLC1v1019602C1 [Oldenlandia corymbosa var. corymbosa]|uniref:OLC1v1019602C1 n=1 Tax=Oldenlandia corymbosa var. corymbosa TaxID=529605 RepID=A0AAV1EEH3_OLDCO|nr:OLC1v1019602C1 [Oldenlandia corymbosa var. corymbosa]
MVTHISSSTLPKNEVRISKTGRLNNYVAYGLKLFHQESTTEVVLKAMGCAIPNAMATMKLICRLIKAVPQVTITIACPISFIASASSDGTRHRRNKWRSRSQQCQGQPSPVGPPRRHGHYQRKKQSPPIWRKVEPMITELSMATVDDEHRDVIDDSGLQPLTRETVRRCEVNQEAHVEDGRPPHVVQCLVVDPIPSFSPSLPFGLMPAQKVPHQTMDGPVIQISSLHEPNTAVESKLSFEPRQRRSKEAKYHLSIGVPNLSTNGSSPRSSVKKPKVGGGGDDFDLAHFSDEGLNLSIRIGRGLQKCDANEEGFAVVEPNQPPGSP